MIKYWTNNGNTYNRSIWASRIKQILDEKGKSNLWVNQDFITDHLKQNQTTKYKWISTNLELKYKQIFTANKTSPLKNT